MFVDVYSDVLARERWQALPISEASCSLGRELDPRAAAYWYDGMALQASEIADWRRT